MDSISSMASLHGCCSFGTISDPFLTFLAYTLTHSNERGSVGKGFGSRLLCVSFRFEYLYYFCMDGFFSFLRLVAYLVWLVCMYIFAMNEWSGWDGKWGSLHENGSVDGGQAFGMVGYALVWCSGITA